MMNYPPLDSLEKDLRGMQSQLQFLEAKNAACKNPFRGGPSVSNDTLVELFQKAALTSGLLHPFSDEDDLHDIRVLESHGISSRLVAAILAVGEVSYEQFRMQEWAILYQGICSMEQTCLYLHLQLAP